MRTKSARESFRCWFRRKSAPGKNMLFVEVEESEEGADMVVKLVRKTLPALGYRGDDIQVLRRCKKGTWAWTI